jgi:2-polyprenyl-3-methyl-5-hydroxy-6-metoxy-1,4-benzoquinol methylase
MQKATRGNGILENFLSNQRSKIALRNIPAEKYNGKILDIGCGSEPFFLRKAPFKEKYGVDRVVNTAMEGKTHLYQKSILEISELQFKRDYFDVITMLAVIEHIYPKEAIRVISEAKKLLKLEGLLILTTPAKWTDKLLKFLSKINLVSKEEINEHKDLFTQEKLKNILREAGFEKRKIMTGTFELGMNLFVVAKK